MKPMVIGDGGLKAPEYIAALKAHLGINLERSLHYAKKSLGAGLNWRA